MPVVLAGAGLVIILLPHLGALKIPVVIYALVLVTMVLSALYRFGKTTTLSFWLVLGGALLFMTSDSLLAINKFIAPLPMAGFWIMLTYGAAQWCIVVGLLQHRR
ncbi:MAG: lysoplasmalogenase [Bacteroidia bacterium]|nr:lysoplasmalogenase [Bacteroidia bacterium]